MLLLLIFEFKEQLFYHAFVLAGAKRPVKM
jgi:hypothetical protein